MLDIPSLYNTCLRQVSLFLKDGIWNKCVENPFWNFNGKIVDDLASTILRIHKLYGFRADDLKLLLTSGVLRELNIEPTVFTCSKYKNDKWISEQTSEDHNEMEREISKALTFLSSASQNLEVLQLICRCKNKNLHALPNVLEALLENSPNLKQVHCRVKFKLKALRNCKKLQSIMLHFVPQEPWYDFLEEENGNKDIYRPLESLEMFTICTKIDINLPESTLFNYIWMLLKYCPSLTSFGHIETSRALAQLKQEGTFLRLKLQSCDWEDNNCIQDAVEYHPFVKYLRIWSTPIDSIAHLKGMKNLVSLIICTSDKRDFSVLLGNVLKDIGVQIKHLKIIYDYPMDISIILQKCPNLEALLIFGMSCPNFVEPTMSLSNLKYLSLNSLALPDQHQNLHLFSKCNNLTQLFMFGNCDDEAIEQFVRRNSLLNLKVALFECCQITKRGLMEILLNAPKLEKINVVSYEEDEPICESYVKSAITETKHKADSTDFCITHSDEFFTKTWYCKYLHS